MKASSKKVVYAALVGNTLVAITKFIAAAITGSSAMLSEGIHSVVDTGNQALLLFGMKKARIPADDRFPFGHGKEVYFWCFVVAILIFALGAGISIYEGIRHLLDPRHIERPYVNYIVLGLAMLFEGGAWTFALIEFRNVKGDRGYLQAVHECKDPTMFVVLFEDSAAMLGLAAAFLGVFLTHITGIPYFDGIASVIIGLILAVTAVWLAVETKSLLIGESADESVVRDIRDILDSCEEIEHVIEVLTMQVGPEYILANVSVDFADGVTSSEIESLIAKMVLKIKTAHPDVKRVFVEAEAYKPTDRDGQAFRRA